MIPPARTSYLLQLNTDWIMDALYTLGYATWTPDDVIEKVEELNALVVDVRFKPYSSKPGFSEQNLQANLKVRYLHFPSFGNANYDGSLDADENFVIYDFEEGRQRLKSVPGEVGFRPQAIILVCGCKDHRRCHRSELATHLAEPASLDVLHLASPGSDRQHALFDQ